MTTRECGECHYCCTVYLIHIESMWKPAGKDCKHVQSCQSGCCSVHEEKPQECRDYLCLWKQRLLPEHMRPDKIDAAFYATDGDGRGKGYEYLVKANTMGDWARGTPAREALDLLAEKTPVVHRPTAEDFDSEIIGPWDEDGEPLPTAKVVDLEKARRPKPKPLTEEEQLANFERHFSV